MKKLLKLLTLALLCGAGAAITSLRAAAPKAEGVAAAAKPDECTVEGQALKTAIKPFMKALLVSHSTTPPLYYDQLALASNVGWKAYKAKSVTEAELKKCCDARKGAAVAGCEVLLRVPKPLPEKLAKAAKPAAAKNICTAERNKVDAEKRKLKSHRGQATEMQKLYGNLGHELETSWLLAMQEWKVCCKVDSGSEGC
jgi:hypothetical protein